MGDAVRRFRRRGEVRARQLTEPVDWVSARGDVLHGSVGDWLVTSADGAVRTVTPAEFDCSYSHINADRYERLGAVQARRAITRERVETLEGPATAYAGDWIVTGPNGNSWPVPDSVFQSGYEPEP